MEHGLDRRDFLKGMTVATVAGLVGSRAMAAQLEMPTAARLPRWRGFNLLEKFIASQENAPFREADFEWLAEWGFNFVRLPMSYRCWSDPARWRELREPVLEEIDTVIRLGRQYGVHVSLNFHRAPAIRSTAVWRSRSTSGPMRRRRKRARFTGRTSRAAIATSRART
jgi:endoglucanase